MFDGLENVIPGSHSASPPSKRIEFGGFDCAGMTGKEHNDPFYIDENGQIKTRTNNHGGILGGISSGMPLIFRVAVKPTASIGAEQQTVDFIKEENTTLSITGRHDPALSPGQSPAWKQRWPLRYWTPIWRLPWI